jgi:hypothetical protein
MDERDAQEEYQAPEMVPVGVAGKPVIPELEQVMRLIGFDKMNARRVAAQIGERICDFAEFSHSDVKMLTESLRGLPTNVRIHVSLAQAKKIKATVDWVRDPRGVRLHRDAAQHTLTLASSCFPTKQ